MCQGHSGKVNLCKQLLGISEMKGEGGREKPSGGLPEGRKTLDRRAPFRKYLPAFPTHSEADKNMPCWLKDQAK